MSIVGADVEQLRTLGKSFAQAADRLQQLTGETSSQLGSVRWVGPDAERFRNEWQGQSVRQVAGAANALRSASDALLRNAQEQQDASAASGGAAVGGGGGLVPGTAQAFQAPWSIGNVADGFRDFTGAAPMWPISNDTLLGSVPGIKNAMPYVDGAAIAFDDRLSTTDKVAEGSHLAYDTLAGAVRGKAAETGDLPGYLLGVGMSQWGDVVYEGARTDVSPDTLNTVRDYIAADPKGAFDAAVGAVKDYVPKLISNFWI